MEQSVFERLAKQFSELCNNDTEVGITATQNVMRAAGRAFFDAISSDKINLGEIPSWFKAKPVKVKKNNDRRLVSWDLYWWCVVAWLIKKKPNSGIFRSPSVKHMKFRKSLLGYSLNKYLKKQLPREKHRKVCYRLAKASETACLYLANSTKDLELPSNLVSCTEISGIIHRRSDSIARTLGASYYPVIKKAGKNYCDSQHAAVLFPKWKKYLKKQQENE